MPEQPHPAPRLLGIGGAHIDRRGQVAGIYVPGASNPGTMREDIGGVVFNALRVARKRGAGATLMSLRGGDAGGAQVAEAIRQAGIEDLSAVFLDRATSSYTALIDRDGDLIAGFADMGLYDLFPRQLQRAACRQAIGSADAILCDANLPEQALEMTVYFAASKPVHAIGISPAKIVRLVGLLDRLACLFMNRKEAAALTGASIDAETPALVELLRGRGLSRGVITAGGGPVALFEPGLLLSIAPPAPRMIVDVTGAGDALAGATVAGLMLGKPFADAVREGLAAAMLALEARAAVPELGAGAFAAALALVPAPAEMA
ncbi:MAG: carbohydrate kinase family protein [Mesorhizobium sp.]|nr:carbohydrate kinase family protein [Mesorhizobium sp.]